MHRTVRASLGWMLLASLPLVMACANLERIEEGDCGNGVVEPGYGEDCEPGIGDFACYPTTSPLRCRFDCDLGKPCPDGYKCGSDKVCREPTPAFERAGGPITVETPFQLLLADVDGDSHEDVVAAGEASVRVHYVEAGGIFGASSMIPTSGVFAAAADLNDDGTKDLAIPAGHGVGIYLGQWNRSLQPATFPTYNAPGTGDAYLMSVEIKAMSDGPELIALREGAAQTFTYSVLEPDKSPGEWKEESLGVGVVGIASAYAPPFAQPCEKLAVRREAVAGGSDSIDVYSPCVQPAQKIATVTLPGGPLDQGMMGPGGMGSSLARRLAGGVFFFDVSGDGLPDLVAPYSKPIGQCSAQEPQCGAIAVAFGHEDGTYGSNPPAEAGNGNTVTYYDDIGPSMPLALGFLDEDGLFDLVTTEGIALGIGDPGAPPPYALDRARYALEGFTWRYAVVGDFNIDGLPDVAGSSDNNITFLNNLGGGVFSPVQFGSTGQITTLAAADMDADGLDDLVYTESIRNIANLAEEVVSLSVAFGAPSGSPEAPMSVGRFDAISQVVPTHIAQFSPDAARDLVVIYPSDGANADNGWSASAVLGSPIRQILSPILMRKSGTQFNKAYPLWPELGRFFASEDPTLDLSVMTLAEGDNGFAAEFWGIDLGLGPSLVSLASPAFASVASSLDGRGLGWTSSVVVDLDGDGVDEVVLAVHEGGGMGLPSARLFRMDPVEGKADKIYEASQTVYTSLRAADFDHDGDQDVLAMKYVVEGMGGMGGMGGQAPRFLTTPVVLYNDGGQLGEPDAFASSATFVSCDPDEVNDLEDLVVLALDVVDADLDPRKEVALVGPMGTYLFHRVEQEGRESLVVACIGSGSPGTTIASGDLTGDGIDDLAIGADGSIHILAGVPERR